MRGFEVMSDSHSLVKWSSFVVSLKSEVAQLCPTLCDPMDCSLPGFSVRGIFQARVLEWGAIAFSEQQQMANTYGKMLYILCHEGIMNFNHETPLHTC